MLALACAGAIPVGAAESFDLTGRWTGKLVCKTATSGVKATVVATPTLAVTQIGDLVGLSLDYGAGSQERYTGLANPDGKKPLTKGELGIIRCGTDSVATNVPGDEIGRLFVATKAAPAVRATLKGQSVVSAPPTLATCAWKWTRTDVVDPGVGTGCDQ